MAFEFLELLLPQLLCLNLMNVFNLCKARVEDDTEVRAEDTEVAIGGTTGYRLVEMLAQCTEDWSPGVVRVARGCCGLCYAQGCFFWRRGHNTF